MLRVILISIYLDHKQDCFHSVASKQNQYNLFLIQINNIEINCASNFMCKLYNL
jgi:hypothetical protein